MITKSLRPKRSDKSNATQKPSIRITTGKLIRKEGGY